MAKRRILPSANLTTTADLESFANPSTTHPALAKRAVIRSGDLALGTSPAPTENKQLRLVTLLRRSEGATVAELMGATGWLSHSVRGALSAVVKRKLGLAVESRLELDRGRVYRIVPPPPAKASAGRRKAKPAPASVSVATTVV